MNRKYKERRRDPRVKFSKAVNYKISPKSNFNLGLGEDISIGGIRLVTFRNIPEDLEVLVEMQVKNEIIRLLSKAIWNKKFSYSGRYTIGFQFDYSKHDSFIQRINSNSKVKRILSDFVNCKLSN